MWTVLTVIVAVGTGLFIAGLWLADHNVVPMFHSRATPKAGVPLWMGIAAVGLFIVAALYPALHARRRDWRALTPARKIVARFHIPMAVVTIALVLGHTAGHLSLTKSGDYALASLIALSLSAVYGRIMEARSARAGRVARSSGANRKVPRWFAFAMKAWRTAHRWLSWITLLLILWHIVAVGTEVVKLPIPQESEMSYETLAAFAVAAAGVTSIIVQIVNDLWVSTSPMTSVQRAAFLRGLNYLLNLGLIVLAAYSMGVFNPHDWFLYVSVAFGQSVASHTGWALLSGSGKSGAGASKSPVQKPVPPSQGFTLNIPATDTTAVIARQSVIPNKGETAPVPVASVPPRIDPSFPYEDAVTMPALPVMPKVRPGTPESSQVLPTIPRGQYR